MSNHEPLPPVPLADEDRAILALESATVVGHTCKVVVVRPGRVDAASLRAVIAERLEQAPPLVRRLGGPPDAPSWVPDERFDVAEHVCAAAVDAPLDLAGLRAEVARLFAERLDRRRPLWRIDVLPLRDEGTALVWRIHHALADGTAAMRFAGAVLWDPAPKGDAPAHAARAGHAEDDARRRSHLAGFLRREFARSRHRSPFDGAIGTRREIAFASLPLRELHDAARAICGATVNDAVLAIVAGALGRWLAERHGRLNDVRVRVPVSLHHEADDAANRDSFFTVGLPLNEPDPVARLRLVHRATEARKEEHDPERLDSLASELAGVSPSLRGFCERVERSPRRFALSVSNVPGPPQPVTVLGAPVESLHAVAEIGERHALRVAVVSLAGRLCFAFCADPGIVDGIAAMAEGTEDEGRRLMEAATR